ncbi:MAG TPA: DUF1080 domain-containing protein [Isosphaeraceae bacterium]|jgi:hypothetical protein|nr:DUF1080 domain-containing protein [Isosphaeraceae bacterium]
MRLIPTGGLVLVALAFAGPARGQYGSISDFKVKKLEDKLDVERVPPPVGAIVLFDGKNLDEWVQADGKTPAAWELVGGSAMQVRGGGGIITRRKFDGNLKLHVEFRVPYLPDKTGQARGNSGVYLQGRYEVQVLDSYGLKSQNNDCGGIYEVAAPLLNACKAPTVWQSYDIDFHPPRFQEGKKVEPARITVYHNGVKIHDNVAIPVDNTRAGLGGDPSQPGPILLQDHGNPVQYRNIWLLPQK